MKYILRGGFNRTTYVKTKINSSEVIQGFGIRSQLIEQNVFQITCAVQDY